MIKMSIVDYRLIHGQIVFGWAKRLNIEHLVIIDDKTYNDNFALSMLKLGVPAEMSLDVYPQSNIKNAIETKETVNKNTLIILPDLFVAFEFVTITGINQLNITNIKEKENSERFSVCCFLNKQEIEIIEKMIDLGVNIDAIPTPGHPTGINLNEILSRR